MSILYQTDQPAGVNVGAGEAATESLTQSALVIGASGGIGQALIKLLQTDARYAKVFSASRYGEVRLDLLSEESIASAAQSIAATPNDLRLIIDATGVLEDDTCVVEKSSADISPEAMARSFAINAIGPALLIKHFAPLLPKNGRSVFVTLSARLGSIGDNRLGGWYSYRASKAALNQIVRTAAVEMRRTRPQAVCLALHPGTVETPLSARYVKTGLEVQSAELAAQRILHFVDQTSTRDSGGFFDQLGRPISW